ncbi:calcium-activated chloride channel-domain-containing protein [Ochromonadaceae sp. CCMP2298]|nr:calcium-activated chloride channel-domain-containing protein [Ochromonadaceae sp. CCMP2298]
MLAIFPMHDYGIAEGVEKQCLSLSAMPWNTPTHDLKEYFGEKIALYVVFLGHYSFYLLIPAIIGLIFQIVVWASGNYSVVAFYSLLIVAWGLVMLEYWRRQEHTTAMKWGMGTFENHEQNRPEFHGSLVRSHINGGEMVYFPEKEAQRLQLFSRSIVSTFVLVVAAVVAGIYLVRFYLQQDKDTSFFASSVASVMNAVQIQVFNLLYQDIVVHLTDNENHRTDTLYEDSMITKLFLFQFINSYSSFFFLAFVATFVTKPDGSHTCMEPLAVNLAIIFGTRLVFNNLLDILLPYIRWRHKLKVETEGVAEDVVLTPAEKDYLLVEYHSMLENISSYSETTVQFGYGMLFIAALPLATTLSLINNWARVKFYIYNLFRFYQRPSPTGAQDIGTWMSIFQFLALAAVVTNAGLICFTMDVLWNLYTIQYRLWIFIGFQWGLFMVQYIAAEMIDDIPREVVIQKQRNEFINLKVGKDKYY